MQKKWRVVFIFKLILFCAFSLLTDHWNGTEAHSGPLDPHSPSVVSSLDFLNHFDRIAFGFMPAPGYGHYATTSLMIKRVRSMGYTKHIDIYICNEGRVRKTIAPLLPGYNPEVRTDQELPFLNATTHEFEYDMFKNSNRPTIRKKFIAKRRLLSLKTLGIIGGDRPGQLFPGDIGVDAVLTVQPSGWSKPTLLVKTQGKPISIIFPDPQSLPYHMEASVPTDPVAFLQEEMKMNPSVGSKLPLLELFEKYQGSHEVLTAYGLSYHDGPKKLAGIIQAIFKARVAQSSLFTGGVLVPMISNFNAEEWAEFFTEIGKVQQLASKVSVVANNDLVSAEQVMRDLDPDHLVILKVGIVPQEVWNYLVSKSSLPPTVSGTSAMNYLNTLGKPFLQTYGLPYLKERAPEYFVSDQQLPRLTYRAIDQMRNSEDQLAKEAGIDQVSRFIIEAKKNDSELIKNYQALRIILENKPDKAIYLLDRCNLLMHGESAE